MYDAYKDYLYSIEHIEGDRIFFFRPRDLWQKITKGMVKRIYKRDIKNK